jgi:threonine dehydrogenase-like Zn-dependent dehydrogenase
MAGASFIAAVDPLASARERALRLGADLAVDPSSENAPTAIRAATDGEGVDLAVECVGANAVLKQAVASLAIDGRAVIVGVGADPIQLGPSALFALLRNRLLSVMGYQRHHLETLVRLVASGRLDVSGSISAELPLEQANEAVAMLAEKRGDPVRILLTP